MQDHRLLIIEDERGIALLLEGVARSVGFEPRTVGDLDALPGVVSDFRPTAILADLNIVGGRDDAVLRSLAESCTGAQVVIMSGSGYRRMAGLVADTIGLNFVGTLDKPFRLHQARSLLNTLKGASMTTLLHAAGVANDT